VDLYDKMLRETDFAKQRALMREFEKYVVDTEAHEIFVLWWYRIIPTSPMSRVGRSARAISSTRTWRQSGSTNNNRVVNWMLYWEEFRWRRDQRHWRASLGALLIGAPFVAPAQETPKNGGVSGLRDPGGRAAQL